MIERAGAAQRDERLRSILLNPRTSRQGRKEILLKHFKRLIRIDAADGNEFTGIIDAEDPQFIELITVMGLVRLPKEAIRQRSEIDSQKAFE